MVKKIRIPKVTALGISVDFNYFIIIKVKRYSVIDKFKTESQKTSNQNLFF